MTQAQPDIVAPLALQHTQEATCSAPWFVCSTEYPHAMAAYLPLVKASYHAPTCSSGQACPHTGYWQAVRLSRQAYSELNDAVICRFEENEIVPTLTVQSREPHFYVPTDSLSVRKALNGDCLVQSETC